MEIYERKQVDNLEILSHDILDNHFRISALFHVIDHFNSICVIEPIYLFFILFYFLLEKEINIFELKIVNIFLSEFC